MKWNKFNWDDLTTWPEVNQEVVWRRQLHPAAYTTEFFTGYLPAWAENGLPCIQVPWNRDGIYGQNEDAPLTHWALIEFNDPDEEME